MKKNRVILFGAGSSGMAFINNTSDELNIEIIAVADNDETKHGTSFHGFPVIEPSMIPEFEYDYVVITSGFALQIKKQLIDELGIDPFKIQIPPKRLLGTYGTRSPFEDPETLLLAKDMLVFVTNVLEVNNITYFVDHGTLLGIIRDRDLIHWDDDIDITVYSEDIERALRCVVDSMHEFPSVRNLHISGNAYYLPNGALSVFVITVEHCNKQNKIQGFPVSIGAVEFQDGLAILPTTYAPEYHFKTYEKVEFHGKNISVPCDYEKYLEFHYGNWRIPKKEMSYLDIQNMKKDWTINSYNIVPILFES